MIDCAACIRALFGSRACIIVYARRQRRMRFRSIDKLYSLLLVYVNHARTTLCFVSFVSSSFSYSPFPLLLILPPSSFSLIIRLRCFRLFVFVSSQPETHPCAANVIAVTRIVLAASSLFRSHGTGISTPSNVSMTNHSIVSSHIVTKIEGEFISIPFIPSTRNHFCEPSIRIS